MNNFAELAEGDGATFLVRWRGRQEGPYPASVIEAKLAANEIGLLHEVFSNGKWVTIRDYISEREIVLRAEDQVRQEQERLAREQAERQAKEREEKQRDELLREERRKNDLLQASMVERQTHEPWRQNQAPILKPHRGGAILTLGIIGLLICGPLCLAAWIMGGSDLREMDAGLMDKSGRSMTTTGHSLGVIGTILWIIAVIIIIVIPH